MKFTAAAISALLCADAAMAGVAAVNAERRRASRLARREGRTAKSKPRVPSSTVSNNTFIDYDDNWAGAVLVSTGFTSVTGTITVPKVSGSSSAAGAAWVGIDGDTCSSAILQTGIDWYGDGTYDAWYEWYPLDSFTFSGITINQGDSIKMTVTATSTSAGSAVIENLTTGKTVTETFSGEKNKLCQTNAEWIVEDFEECEGSSCSYVPFANFGSVEFTSASAVKSGSTVGPSGATIFDIEQNNKVLTSCSAGSSTVSCSYV